MLGPLTRSPEILGVLVFYSAFGIFKCMRRLIGGATLLLGLLTQPYPVHAAISNPQSPAGTLRGIDPRTISSGLFLSLAADGYYGGILHPPSPHADGTAPAKGTPPPILDARVGDNIQLGTDPNALLPGQRSQAEPHAWRAAAFPELIVATFQEGRYAAGGGSLDCGYAISNDGGIKWTRALIPRLTSSSGGAYLRATDPVAAVDLYRNIYLCTLAARQSAFSDGGVVVVSRSIDGGLNFGTPSVIATGSTTHSLDKNWMAVNDYPTAPNANRLVVTYTDIYPSGNSYYYDLLASVSDDLGVNWSTPTLIKPRNSLVNQVTQPFFLPSGALIVPYITNYGNGTFRIECQRSADGGRTFPNTPSVIVSSVREWADPVLRSGTFVITAWVARETGAAFVTYTGLDNNLTPRVFVTKSTDGGSSWSPPIVASDNPNGVSVLNPAVAATPDGQRVTVTYYDKRNATDGTNYLDLYSNTSFDGGASWQPGLRLTEYSSDVRVAPFTSQGYMLGDYQGLVPPFNSNQPAIAITVDTRNGDGDPYAIRYALAPAVIYDGWSIAHFSGAEIADSSISGLTADPDGDGICNAAEYYYTKNPRRPDYSSLFSCRTYTAAPPAPSGSTGVTASIGFNHRQNFGFIPIQRWECSPDGTTWTPANSLLDIINPVTPLPNDPESLIKVFELPANGTFYFREVFSPDATFASIFSGEVLLFRSNSRLVNLSSRGQVKIGDSRLIVGFVINSASKSVLVRGIGPSLANFGVTSPLVNPQLDLNSSGSPAFATVHNDDWSQNPGVTAALFSRLGAFALPAGSLDSAIVQNLDAQPYTAILSGVNNGTGIGIIEAYDADTSPGAPNGPRLSNLSARGEVGARDNLLIGGFVISGVQPHRVLIRAVGPTLAQYGLAGSALPDPVLTLFLQIQSGAQSIATNDDWQLSGNPLATAWAATSTGAFALSTGSLDSALLLTLAPGIYTAQVSGYNGTTGIALVEIYDAD